MVRHRFALLALAAIGGIVNDSHRSHGEQEGDAGVFVSLAELMARPELLAPPEAVVRRIAYRGRLVLVAAPDKSGKTTLLANVAEEP